MNKKDLFSRLPVSLQNMLFTGYGYYKKKQRYGKKFQDCLKRLKETEFYEQEMIAEFQNEELRKLVNEIPNIPYYRNLVHAHQINLSQIQNIDDLSKFPLLDKITAKTQAKKLLNNRYKKKELYSSSTGGTTGTPQKIYYTKDAMRLKWATFWRHRAQYGFFPEDKFIMFGSHLPILTSSPKQVFWRVNKTINQHYVSTYDLKEDNFRMLVQYMNQEKFKFIVGYPSSVYDFTMLMKKHNIHLDYKPEVFFSASDVLLHVHEKLISEYLGVEVTDFYGNVEFCGNFARCKQKKYHLDFETGIVRFLPVAGKENSVYRRMIFTGTGNLAMPFINYDIGDYAIVPEQACRCGRKSVIIDSIEGRLEDSVKTPDGRTIIKFAQVFKSSPAIREAQITQDTLHQITLKIVPENSYTKKDEEKVLQKLKQRLGDLIEIKLDYVEHIKPSRSGKRRLVISHLQPENEGEKELHKRVEGELEK